MKKLFVVAVVSLGTLTGFAQEAEAAEAVGATEMVAQDEYSEIEISALPEAVTNALAKDHPEATISKAYVNKKEQFKLEVAHQDGTSATLFADKKGNWIEE
ncbi:hypothetical protein SAMN04487911_12243 [Arenibacter nanhaiticus]|uniref:Beta-lactamase-inhibitor-like, PepSY-like n=1 Tax=Arenibacter nanhaiticus TaxID=558155 RepID=A0A1M6JLA2_9FLAO|nr:hypothetical protein [Arenibacter nanhaiticus]SHJ47465.1 hypothetical protein SAMN04487911_12243 [Arenibacter nanhaiticus]